jgi:hypothetical protein
MIDLVRKNSDELGMVGSALCIIHCLATPFLLVFLAASPYSQVGNYYWWTMLDVVFLGVSVLAVWITIQRTAFRWIKIGMVVSLLLLAFFIFNERLEGIEFPVDMVYFPAVALVILHIINLRKCRCETACCDDIQS